MRKRESIVCIVETMKLCTLGLLCIVFYDRYWLHHHDSSPFNEFEKSVFSIVHPSLYIYADSRASFRPASRTNSSEDAVELISVAFVTDSVSLGCRRCCRR